MTDSVSRFRFALVFLMVFGIFARAGLADDGNSLEPIPITVLQLQGNGVSEEYAKTVSELLAVELARFPEVRVTNDADLRRMMDLEAEKQSLGCDESSCLLEIAAALGTRYVVWGSVGELGKLVVVTVNLFDSDVQRSVNRDSGQAQGIENAPAMLGPLAERLVTPILPERVRIAKTTAKQKTLAAAPAKPGNTPKQPRKKIRRRTSSRKGQNLVGWGSLLFGAASFSLGYCGEIAGSSISATAYPEYEYIVPLSFIPLAGPPLVAIAGDATDEECAAGCLALSCQLAGCAGLIGGTTLLLWDDDENDARQARAGVDPSLYGWLPASLRSLEHGSDTHGAKSAQGAFEGAVGRMAF